MQIFISIREIALPLVMTFISTAYHFGAGLKLPPAIAAHFISTGLL